MRQVLSAPTVALALVIGGLSGPMALSVHALEGRDRPPQVEADNVKQKRSAPMALPGSRPEPKQGAASAVLPTKKLSAALALEGAGLPELTVLGVPHTIRQGETLEHIAQLYNIPAEDIVGFQPNKLVSGGPLPKGKRIFIPGATPLLPSPVVMDRREVEPAGLVSNGRSNVRRGPGLRYAPVAQVEKGSYVRLLGRHGDWFKVEVDGKPAGWMASEVLTVPGFFAVSLPQVSDFPPPPAWVWPAAGGLTSGFGWRSDPWRMFHNGIDIANAEGVQVVAVRDGVVTQAGWCAGYGYCVKIRHEKGFESIYGHLFTKPKVTAGDVVHVRQPVGLLGNTFDLAGGGYSTGPHLHFTLKHNGEPIDPLRYLP